MRGEGRGSIFVYKPVTSIEINISSFRSFVFSMKLMKPVASFYLVIKVVYIECLVSICGLERNKNLVSMSMWFQYKK